MPASSDTPAPLARFGAWFARLLNVVAVISSLAVTGLMAFLVVARYVLGLPVVGLHELIMLAAVVLYMTGAMIASRKREHLTVDWMAGVISDPRKKAAHDLLVAGLTTIITVFFMVWSYRMFAWGMQRPQVTPAFQIPLWVPQMAVGVASVVCFAYAVRDVADAARRLKDS
ncbi:TRAP transporter small permease [Tropicimonas sp.]|uniref:TRAP transporter small permease n=1 Tax=Tropicimonas sp. TaxID=2067044 RepID=UPI003A84C02F